MVRNVLCLFVAALLFPAASFAQQAVLPYVVTGTDNNNVPTSSPLGNGSGGSVGLPAFALTTIPKSTVPGTSLASVYTLAPPANATTAIVTVYGTNNASNECAFWEDDGIAPTSTAGQPLPSLGGLVYKVKSLPLQVIQASGATCSLTVSYYR